MSYLETHDSSGLLERYIYKHQLFNIPGAAVYKALDPHEKLLLLESLLEENFNFHDEINEWIEDLNGYDVGRETDWERRDPIHISYDSTFPEIWEEV